MQLQDIKRKENRYQQEINELRREVDDKDWKIEELKNTGI
jgi:predicted RNase H-like nuclease (RuvC/YqgF family)